MLSQSYKQLSLTLRLTTANLVKVPIPDEIPNSKKKQDKL